MSGVRRPRSVWHHHDRKGDCAYFGPILLGVTQIEHHAKLWCEREARVAMIELGADGHGRETEESAFLGPVQMPDLSLSAPGRGVCAVPAQFDASRARADDYPAAVFDSCGLGRIRAVLGGSGSRWMPNRRGEKHSRPREYLTPMGLNVRFENKLPGTAESPLLIWGHEALRLKDLPKVEILFFSNIWAGMI